MLALTPLLLAAAGVCAALTTVTVKWALIGRYGPGEHPLWSSFVWRDEIVNTCQEQLAGGWLLRTAMATPLLNMYLRMMGVTVGREVWCETLNVTEFDTVTIGDGAVINRHAVVETHLFQDRLLRIGPARLGAGATLGPATAILPDTVIGAHCRISGRSVVMRGEQLPPATRWHGAPVVATR
jgi:non-ribosomal peptide synthetase-like protein